MPVPEAPMTDTPGGRMPAGPGWFVLNLADARGVHVPGSGTYLPLENREHAFEDFGINVHVLEPGERATLYHEEPAQEGFLVLAGECLALIEEQERVLRAWDFFHCAPETRHSFIGAGDGPCVIVMVGSRRLGGVATYPASEVAARHGVSARETTGDDEAAYRGAGWSEERIETPGLWARTWTSSS
jgi:uncharacterized cupin superfamily protein